MKMAITFLHEPERDGIVESNHFFSFYSKISLIWGPDWRTNCVWSAQVMGRHGEVIKWRWTSKVALSVTMMVRVKLP